MKIAQIVCTFPPYAGGIGNSALTIGELLAPRHQVTTFFPKSGKKQKETRQKTIPLKPWLRYGHGAFLPSLLPKLRNHDCIYLHYPFFGTMELIWLFQLLSFNKRKLVVHYHMDATELQGAARVLSLPSRILSRSLFKKADTIITAGLDYVKNSSLAPIYKKYPEKFREIPFGVDTSRFQSPMKRTSGPARILFVGGLDRAHYFKGVNVLLEAAAELKNKEWELTIVGEGDLKPEYEKKADSLGVTDKVNFPGKLEEQELIRAYQQSDIFVLPSINSGEAFGIVLIEAMACGLPVIASELPGVRKVFQNGKEGLLAKPGDKNDLTAKIEILLNDPNKRKAMGEKSRKKAEKEYSLASMQKKLERAVRGRNL